MEKKNKELYIELWKKLLPDIIVMLKKAADNRHQSKQLNETMFVEVGNRKKSGYGFNLVFHGTTITNNIDGSAVARDLANVLLDSPEANKILRTGKYKINMRKKYYLTIQKL
jgi:hypothetical protein